MFLWHKYFFFLVFEHFNETVSTLFIWCYVDQLSDIQYAFTIDLVSNSRTIKDWESACIS